MIINTQYHSSSSFDDPSPDVSGIILVGYQGTVEGNSEKGIVSRWSLNADDFTSGHMSEFHSDLDLCRRGLFT
jgi:hypothetical protein